MSPTGQEVAEDVRDLYKKYPFPGDLNAYGPWRQQAPSLLAGLNLDPSIVQGKTVLDAGCGTGEFARSFALLGARVTAVDITSQSIEKARSYDRAEGVHGVRYRQGSIFDLDEAERYDIVISLGVLHHTHDPRLAFTKVSSAVAPNGLLVVGLYNPISRSPILLTRALIRALSRRDLEKGVKLASTPLLQPLIRRCVGEANQNKRERIADLLANPHERPVSIRDTLAWYEEAGFSVIGSDPSTDIDNYSRPVRLTARLPLMKTHAIELQWLRWNADYYKVAGRRNS
jgi:2-polyprenyl-3-methyl-5-hydroxy-6-metoxy-1,4-benzoquinol methylase